MSSDRETRQRLEEVQQRLAGIEAEVELEESPGFADELRHLEAQLDLARGRGQRTEDRLRDVQQELATAERTVRELELAKQARQSNNIDDVVGALAAVLALVVIGALTVVCKKLDPPLEVIGTVGFCCSAALGAVLRARVVRPRLRARRD
ncbi:MAG: hypothetical protein QM723_16795 [Myxococcaceae bacterium]